MFACFTDDTHQASIVGWAVLHVDRGVVTEMLRDDLGDVRLGAVGPEHEVDLHRFHLRPSTSGKQSTAADRQEHRGHDSRRRFYARRRQP